MDEGPDGPAPSGDGAEHERLAHALRGTCGAPCADALSGLRESAAATLSAAREQRATLVAATAQAQLAAALGADGDLTGAARHRSGATALLARVPTAAPVQRRTALLWLAVVDWSVLGDVRAARDRLARAAVLTDGDEAPQIALPVLALRALASTLAGDLAGAARTAREALARARASEDPALLAIALAAQVHQLSARGERDAALAAGEQLLELRDGDAEIDAIAGWAVVPALLEAGEAERAGALIAAATTTARLARTLPQTRSALLDARVRSAVTGGDASDARAQLIALEQLAFSQTPLGAAVAGSAAALVALAADHPLNAEVRATAAAEHARRTPSRLLELRATLLAGRAQAALGAPDVAAERFAEAEEIARGLGAHARAEQALNERRALVGHSDEPSAIEAYGLTPRQLEIARLVADGATNREVASSLGISEHTVNTHLRVAFNRLGVTRRTALAQALNQRTAR